MSDDDLPVHSPVSEPLGGSQFFLNPQACWGSPNFFYANGQQDELL